MILKENRSKILTENPFNGTIYSIENGQPLYADKLKNLYGHQLNVPHLPNVRSRVKNEVLSGLDGMMLAEMAKYFNASFNVKEVYNLKKLGKLIYESDIFVMPGIWKDQHLNRLILNENSGICIVVPSPTKKNKFLAGILINQYSPELWSLLIVLYGVIIFFIRCFGHFTNIFDLFFNVTRMYLLVPPSAEIWTKFENFLMQPLCFLLFILQNVYTTTLTSDMTTDEFYAPIQSIEQLNQANLKVIISNAS